MSTVNIGDYVFNGSRWHIVKDNEQKRVSMPYYGSTSYYYNDGTFRCGSYIRIGYQPSNETYEPKDGNRPKPVCTNCKGGPSTFFLSEMGVLDPAVVERIKKRIASWNKAALVRIVDDTQ